MKIGLVYDCLLI